MVWYIINFPSFFTNKRVDSIINISFFINSVRVKSFWIIRISRLSSPLWIEDIIISYGFVNLSRRQYIFILLIICLFKESSRLIESINTFLARNQVLLPYYFCIAFSFYTLSCLILHNLLQHLFLGLLELIQDLLDPYTPFFMILIL
jgi:hypothetical protein